MLIDAEDYQRTLGDELRKLRRQRGWTRKELRHRLHSDISLQTLATYELGTRQCSVVRLVELCVAMEELPQNLLARVHGRIFTTEPGRIRVDLDKVAASSDPDLRPLRHWAQDRLRRPTESTGTEVSLDLHAIGWLAKLCGLESEELIRRLNELTTTDGPPRRHRVAD